MTAYPRYMASGIKGLEEEWLLSLLHLLTLPAFSLPIPGILSSIYLKIIVPEGGILPPGTTQMFD